MIFLRASQNESMSIAMETVARAAETVNNPAKRETPSAGVPGHRMTAAEPGTVAPEGAHEYNDSNRSQELLDSPVTRIEPCESRMRGLCRFVTNENRVRHALSKNMCCALTSPTTVAPFRRVAAVHRACMAECAGFTPSQSR